MALVGVNGQTQIFDYYYTISTTLTPAFNFAALVHVIGAGGSGGATDGENGAICIGTGGGAGGHAISRLNFTSGVTYTITIGAGGEAITTSAASVDDGNAGGASSISGSDITTMTANGGGAGQGSAPTSIATHTEAGGTGGTATGGNIANLTGGAGGAVSCVKDGNNRSGLIATGGGALNIGRGAFAGGAVTTSATSNTAMRRSTGGGGVGGKAADLTATYAEQTNQAGNGGAGVGPAANLPTSSTGNATREGALYPYIALSGTAADAIGMAFGQNIFSSFIAGTTVGNSASSAESGYQGAGGAGTVGAGYGGTSTFGGGGSSQPSNYSNRSAGLSYWGGGGGGMVTHSNVTGNISGRGGHGLVIIRVLEV